MNICTESPEAARASFKKLQQLLLKNDFPINFHNPKNATFDELKELSRSKKAGRNIPCCSSKEAAKLIEAEFMRQDGGGSIITRKGMDMADQSITSAEILDKATEVIENQLVKFNRVSDSAIAETKKRVSQLTDYNNRLGVALGNLNKTLGDEKMARALENAEKLVTALTLLDELEKRGSLQKMMHALNPS